MCYNIIVGGVTACTFNPTESGQWGNPKDRHSFALKTRRKEMTVKDVIALGKMGYSKKEVEKLLDSENSKIENDTQEQLDSLVKQVSDLTEKFEMRATHEPLTDKKDMAAETDVDTILRTFAEGADDGEKES